MRRLSKSVRLALERLEDRLTPSDNPSLVPPVLNSLLGAPATLYLDFNGHTDATWGNFNNVDTPPYDTDGNANTWSATEIQQIKDIWTHVAEDFAPFNINVSTVKPASFAPKVAQRVAFGGDGAWSNTGAFAISHLNSFNGGAGSNSTGDDTCYVFNVTILAAGFIDPMRSVAFGAVHESGHTFGLEHQSDYDAGGNLTAAYSVGLTDGTSPNMGGNPDPVRNMWWYGHNVISATTFQDDMAVIANSTNGFGFRIDDHADAAAGATLITPTGTGVVNVSKTGVIAKMTDADFFSVKAIAGPLKFTADVNDPFNNLDVKLELRDSAGNMLASDDPASSFDATVSFNVTTPDTYYLRVASHGVSSAATGNNYGQDVGGYTINGSYVTDSAATGGGVALKLLAPVRWIYNAKAKTYRAVVTLVSSIDITGPFTVTIKLPHPSVQWISPNGTRIGNTVKITFNQKLVAKKPFHFSVVVKNPQHKNLGTFFRGLKAIG